MSHPFSAHPCPMCGSPSHVLDTSSLTVVPREDHEIAEEVADLRLRLQLLAGAVRGVLEAWDRDGGPLPLRAEEEIQRMRLALGEVARG